MTEPRDSPTNGPARWRGAALLAAAGLAMQVSCAGVNQNKNQHQSDSAAAPGAALAQVHQLVGDAACTVDADCRTIAIGSKACGGPESYLAWSVRQTRSQTLAVAAERYANERKAQDQASGRVSNCMIVTDPGARCDTAVPAHCVLRRGAVDGLVR